MIDSASIGIDFQPNRHPIALHVEDFEAARAELSSRGWSSRDTIDSGVCLTADSGTGRQPAADPPSLHAAV